MGAAIFVTLFFVVAILSFFLGTLVADRRWFRILNSTHVYYAEQQKRILSTPVYIAQQPTFEDEGGICPDCGESHNDPSDDGKSGTGAN